jgi:hypothetical protein
MLGRLSLIFAAFLLINIAYPVIMATREYLHDISAVFGLNAFPFQLGKLHLADPSREVQ